MGVAYNRSSSPPNCDVDLTWLQRPSIFVFHVICPGQKCWRSRTRKISNVDMVLLTITKGNFEKWIRGPTVLL